jgi:hypothetical protein
MDDALGVGEGHPAGAWHDSSIGEDKAKIKLVNAWPSQAIFLA